MLRYFICKVSPSLVIDLRQAAVTLITTGHEKIKKLYISYFTMRRDQAKIDIRVLHNEVEKV